MFDNIFGLPMHPLVVHATVVVVPTAALAVFLAAVWPRFRDWAGWLPLLLAAAATVLVPVSTESGESLEHRVTETALIEKHAQLAEGLLPWVIGLLVAAALVTAVARGLVPKAGRIVPVAAVVVALVAAAGTVTQVARIGHSGAKASWSDVPTAQVGGDSDED